MTKAELIAKYGNAIVFIQDEIKIDLVALIKEKGITLKEVEKDLNLPRQILRNYLFAINYGSSPKKIMEILK